MSSSIRRRTFLRATAAGACSVSLFPRSLRAEAAKLADLSFTVVTDTHLGYRDEGPAAKQWAKTVEEIANSRATSCCTWATSWTGGVRLSIPCTSRFASGSVGRCTRSPETMTSGSLREALRKSIDTAVEHEWLRFLLLNNARRDSHDGFLSDRQLAWLDDQISQAERQGQYAIVCMHVPAHDNKHPDVGWYVKPEQGQTKFYALLKRRRAARAGAVPWPLPRRPPRLGRPRARSRNRFSFGIYNNDRRLAEEKAPATTCRNSAPGFTTASIKAGTLTLRYKPVGDERATEKQCRLIQLKK